MDFEIPAGLTDILQDFTVAVLREKPTDLIQFACDYFNNLNENRVTSKLIGKKGVSFGGGPSDDEPMQTDSSDEEPIGKLTGLTTGLFTFWNINVKLSNIEMTAMQMSPMHKVHMACADEL